MTAQQMNEPVKPAYWAGVCGLAAPYAGKTIFDNPYDVGTEERRKWHRAYLHNLETVSSSNVKQIPIIQPGQWRRDAPGRGKSTHGRRCEWTKAQVDFMWKHRDRLTRVQIGVALGKPVEAVKSKLCRLRKERK